MENLDPKKNPITTIPGLCFVVLGLLMYALPMFVSVKKDFTDTWYVPLIVIGVGILLIFVPDSLAKTLLGGLGKKIDSKTDDNK